MFYRNYISTTKPQLFKAGLLCLLLLPTTLSAMKHEDDDNESSSGAVTLKHVEQTDLQGVLTRLNLMSSELRNLREENASLKEKVERLTNPTPFSMLLSHKAPKNEIWTPCPVTKMRAMAFEQRTLNGETQTGSFSEVIIPEDGVYEITGFSRWKTTEGYPFAGIAIDTLEGVDRQTSGSNENPNQWKLTSYNVTKKLRKDQKVMLFYSSE